MIKIDLDGYEFRKLVIGDDDGIIAVFFKEFEGEMYRKRVKIPLEELSNGEKTSLFALIKKVLKKYLTDETFNIIEVSNDENGE